MSVAHIDCINLGSFAAAAVRHNLATLADLVDMLAAVSAANAAALADQYGDQVDTADRDEIEAQALEILADRIDAAGWPPLAYNCVTNAGRDYLAADVADQLRDIETRCSKLADYDDRTAARAEDDAVAYDDVPQLRTMDAAAIAQAMADAGADRVIVAKFRVDESDSHSDYWGHRTSREVVIGFGRGKRESFAQLRKAAAAFKPTADYGPGRGRWFAYPVVDSDFVLGSGEHMYQGSRSPWHSDNHAGPLPTRAAAEAHAAGIPLQPIAVDGKLIPIVWHVREEKIEHRENYSMGGGNYLGDSRHSGWTVSSSTYVPQTAEVYSTAAHGGKPARK
jgi:hypothetical protein